MNKADDAARTQIRAAVQDFDSPQAFVAVVVVMLATFVAPSFYRILGSRVWGLLGWSEAQWALVLAVRALVLIFFVLAAGLLGDFLGRRRLLLLTLGAFIACLLASLILPVGQVSTAIQTPLGILGSMIRVLTVTMVILIRDPRERLLRLIVYSALAGAASVLAPSLSAQLLSVVDVGTLFWPPLALAVAGVILIARYIPESRASRETGSSAALALLAWTLGLCLLIFAGILLTSLGWKDPLVYVTAIVGAGILVTLNVLARAAPAAARLNRLQFQRPLGIAVFAGVVMNLTLLAVLMQTFNFLYKVQGAGTVLAALGLAPMLVGALLFSKLGIGFNSRIGIRDAIAAGLLAVAVPALGLFLLQPGLSYFVLLPFLLVLGFGFILGNAPRLVLLGSAVPIDLSATVQSIGSATVQLGGALSYSFVLTLLTRFAGDAYGRLLGAAGLPAGAIAERLAALANTGEGFPLVVTADQQEEILRTGVDVIVKQAYVSGISHAMLVVAAICVLSALIVRMSLPHDTRSVQEV